MMEHSQFFYANVKRAVAVVGWVVVFSLLSGILFLAGIGINLLSGG